MELLQILMKRIFYNSKVSFAGSNRLYCKVPNFIYGYLKAYKGIWDHSINFPSVMDDVVSSRMYMDY